MSSTNNLSRGNCADLLMARMRDKQADIYSWLRSQETIKDLPLYSSVDIRDACFKIAVVDTNLFPAGFNNLCEHGIEDSAKFIRSAILERVPQCQKVLLVVEEHTRNTWYLENIRILEEIIKNAGFQARIATFFNIQPEFCESANYIELETATQKSVRIYCFKKILNKISHDEDKYDLIILNNDLTSGIPDVLKHSHTPIYPSIQAGWHSRSKSHHFELANKLLLDFANILDLDPWYFSCFFRTAEKIDVNDVHDRQKLMDLTSDLFKDIRQKYAEHKLEQKPFVFLKGDSGTYGMAVVPIEDPNDILELNRRARNNLSTGKSAQVIEKYLIQEGVPTVYSFDNKASEVCVYQITNNMVGGFYRVNSAKSDRQNLNSPGMEFKRMCPHLPKYGCCESHSEINIFDIYRILARIAVIAAHQEILHLESQAK